MGMDGQRHDPAALTPGKGTGSHCKEVGRAPGLVSTGAENLVPKELQFPEGAVRSKVAVTTALFPASIYSHINNN